MGDMGAGSGMLVVETIAKIRRAYFAQKKPIKAAREFRLSRKVVRQVIRSEATEFRYERGRQPLPRIDPWRAQLDALLLPNEGSLNQLARAVPIGCRSAVPVPCRLTDCGHASENYHESNRSVECLALAADARLGLAAMVARSARELASVFRITLPRCALTAISLADNPPYSVFFQGLRSAGGEAK